MIDEQLRCGNPACGLPIVVLPGHRRRQYCNEAQYYASCHEVQSSKPEKTLHPQRPVYHVTDPTFLLRKARFLGKTGRRERKSPQYVLVLLLLPFATLHFMTACVALGLSVGLLPSIPGTTRASRSASPPRIARPAPLKGNVPTPNPEFLVDCSRSGRSSSIRPYKQHESVRLRKPSPSNMPPDPASKPPSRHLGARLWSATFSLHRRS